MADDSVAQESKKEMQMHTKIFMGMIMGFVIGLILNNYAPQYGEDKKVVESSVYPFYEHFMEWTRIVGREVFVAGLQMLIAPLVFSAIVSGVTSLPGMDMLKKIGFRTLMYYALTTTVAVAIGLACVLVVKPGISEAADVERAAKMREYDGYKKELYATKGINLEGMSVDEVKKIDAQYNDEFIAFIAKKQGDMQAEEKVYQKASKARDRRLVDVFREDIVQKVLSKPFAALSENTTLGLIFFAMLVGLACLSLGEKAASVTSFFVGMNEVMITLTLWFMKIAPLAIACLIANMVGATGLNALKVVMKFGLCVVLGIALHVCFLNLLVWFKGGMSPKEFLSGIRAAWLVAFSTSSSQATLPVTMNCVKDHLKVDDKVANFTLPLGATVNMDGTALFEGISIIFLMQLYGGLPDVPELTFTSTILIFITAVIASIGAAAVPSAGLITMALVATAVGLPVHYILIIYAIDRILDMFRTSTNIMGDSVVAVVVDRSQSKLTAE